MLHLIAEDLLVDDAWILVLEIEAYLAKVARFQELHPNDAPR